jgi:predicted transposase/invertase (TIGR01784 family)
MSKPIEIYQNLLTDFGFKFVFTKEEYLVPFLNELLQGKEKIKSVKQLRTERFGKTKDERRAVFDIYCENEKGELILLEMQKIPQTYFLDRSIYYSSYLIQQQGKKGEWDFCLKKMYIVGILNFVPLEMKEKEDYICRANLCDVKTKDVISDKLNFIFVSLKKFNKTSDELETLLDYWLYVLSSSPLDHEMAEDVLRKKKFFAKLLDTIKIEKLNKEDMKLYTTSKRDFDRIAKLYMTGYAEQWLKEGMQKGRLETALNALKQGLSAKRVSGFTGLSLVEVENLQRQSK